MGKDWKEKCPERSGNPIEVSGIFQRKGDTQGILKNCSQESYQRKERKKASSLVAVMAGVDSKTKQQNKERRCQLKVWEKY